VNNIKGVAHPGITSQSGPYVFQLPTHTHSIVAAHASLPRKDIIVVRIWDDDEDSSGLRQVDTEYVTGTAAASPAEPSLPGNSFRIATIDIPANNTAGATVTNNYPIAVAAGAVHIVRNDAELTGTADGLYEGALRWNIATGTLDVHDGGSTWETLASPSALAPGTLVAHLQRAADQALADTLASSSATAISWDTEVLDRLNCWAIGSNPDRYQPNVAGWYMFEGMVSFDPDTDGTTRACAWRKNGSAIDGNVNRAHVAGTGTSTATAIAVPMPISMNGTTDYVELVGMHDAGADMVTANSGFRCSLTVTYVGPL